MGKTVRTTSVTVKEANWQEQCCQIVNRSGKTGAALHSTLFTQIIVLQSGEVQECPPEVDGSITNISNKVITWTWK